MKENDLQLQISVDVSDVDVYLAPIRKAHEMAVHFQAERDEAIAQALKAEGELKKFTDDRALLAQDLAEARAERDLHKAALEKAQADLRDTLVDLSRADTGRAHAEAKRDRLAVDALAALAEAGIATPEEGYVVETHCLSHDIATLARERDALAAEAAMQREALEGAVKILSNPAAPIAYLSHYGPKINAALATPSQGAEWLAGHDKKTRADELARCEIEWNEATAFASQPKTPSMREIIDAHDAEVLDKASRAIRSAFDSWKDGDGIFLHHVQDAVRALAVKNAVRQRQGGSEGTSNARLADNDREGSSASAVASPCVEQPASGPKVPASATFPYPPEATSSAGAVPLPPPADRNFNEYAAYMKMGVIEQPQNPTAVRTLRGCAMPGCKNIEHPRGGGYCDRHPFEELRENNARLAKCPVCGSVEHTRHEPGHQ